MAFRIEVSEDGFGKKKQKRQRKHMKKGFNNITHYGVKQ